MFLADNSIDKRTYVVYVLQNPHKKMPVNFIKIRDLMIHDYDIDLDDFRTPLIFHNSSIDLSALDPFILFPVIS